jgi:hypothetical protein
MVARPKFFINELRMISVNQRNFVHKNAVTGGNPIFVFGKDSSKVLFEDMLGFTVGSVENGMFAQDEMTAFGDLCMNTSKNFGNHPLAINVYVNYTRGMNPPKVGCCFLRLNKSPYQPLLAGYRRG